MARFPLKTSTDLSKLGYSKTAQKAPVHTTKVYGGAPDVQLHSFLTSTLYGGQCLLDVGLEPPVPIAWAPQPMSTIWKKKLLALPGIEPQFLRRPARTPTTLSKLNIIITQPRHFLL